uniref:Uncharacterized protein n=1 Tax=Clytia hemisphaerica TaxID=252671 RepID=A0A7M5UTI9_9CNID
MSMSFGKVCIETQPDQQEKQTSEQGSSESESSYKTPQQLFSSFQIPDIDSPAVSDTSTESPDSPCSPVTQKSLEKSPKLQNIKPNIIKHPPTQLKLTSSFPTMHAPKIFPTSVQATQTTGKPLLVQGHANAHAHQQFYFMNQGANGFIGYQTPIPPTTAYQPGMYGLSSPFVDPRFIFSPQPPTSAIIKKDTAANPPLSKEIKMLDSSPASSSLRQTCANIQGQMAANQIPLCLVQDSQGQLHQLVYTVPENLYEKYVTAAKKGFKVRVQPHLDSLKVALSNNATSKPKIEEENEKRIFNDEDLKLVKDIKLNEQTSPMKTETQDIEKIISKSKVKAPEKGTKILTMSVLEQLKENSCNKNEKERLTVTKNPTTTATRNVTPSDVNKSHTTVKGTSQFSSTQDDKDLSIHSQEQIVTEKGDMKINDKTPIKIDLTSSPCTASGHFETEQSIEIIDEPSPTQHNKTVLKRKIQSPPLMNTSDEKISSLKTLSDHQIKSPTPLPKNDFVLDDLTQPNECNELYHNINTIDGILAKNSNALIPKSDVEALLRCLKRKLEENDIAEHLSKRHKLQENNAQSTPNKLSDNRKAFHTKCNSYDYDSLDMLSPESLPEDENSVFYSNTDIPSVSSLGSSSEKIVPSVTSSLDAFDTSLTDSSPNLQNMGVDQHLDLFDNFKDDIFSTDSFVYGDILPNTTTNDKIITKNTNFNNNTNIQDKLINSTDNFSFPSGQQNYDMDLFDHLWSELDNL